MLTASTSQSNFFSKQVQELIWVSFQRQCNFNNLAKKTEIQKPQVNLF